MQVVRVAAALGVAVVIASCATAQKSVGGWFGAPAPTSTPTPSPKPRTTAATAAQAIRVYYAGVEGLKVYGEASASSQVVGTLSLGEKVRRVRVERGFAFVESTKSGVKGWVDNAQLTWRLPTAPATAGSAPGEAKLEEAQPEEAPPDEAPPEEPAVSTGEERAPAAPEATVTAAEPLPATTPAPTAAPLSLRTPRAIGPSIFNPY